MTFEDLYSMVQDSEKVELRLSKLQIIKYVAGYYNIMSILKCSTFITSDISYYKPFKISCVACSTEIKI